MEILLLPKKKFDLTIFSFFYSIRLSAKERGVMVIKSKDKTRASQRKGALSNWKVISKKDN